MTDVKILSSVNPDIFLILYEMLESIVIPYKSGKSGRRGFKKHRACVFGKVRQRYTGKIAPSRFINTYPEIYDELLKIGSLICPIPFTSVYVNHNVVCPPHKDETNVGESVLVSFGDYTGCDFMIKNNDKIIKYNTFCQPIMLNASKIEHWNTDDLIGNKYSLVFYTGTNM
jgi:hypothetical protein